MRKVRGIALAMMLAGMVATAVPASAAENHGPIAGDLAFECEVTLSVWPTSTGGGATCIGVAVGVVVHNGAEIEIAAGSNFTANVTSYNEGCLLGEPPLTGTAAGSATVQTTAGPLTANFSWTRVGLTAAVTISSVTFDGHTHSVVGGGAAAFVPLPPIPTCDSPAALTALVAGDVAIAGA